MEIKPELYSATYPLTNQTETLGLLSQVVRDFRPVVLWVQTYEAAGSVKLIEGRIIAGCDQQPTLCLDYRLRALGEGTKLNLTEASLKLYSQPAKQIWGEIFSPQAQYVQARDRRWLAALSVASSTIRSAARALVHKRLANDIDSATFRAYQAFFQPKVAQAVQKLGLSPANWEEVNGADSL